jgi:4a-hydroxytetrahydrobiopterin dehydratase
MPALLSEKEIAEALKTLPGWSREKGALVCRFAFKSYMDGIRFVEAVAVEAEARDHHPDLLVRYGDVTVFLSTHSAGGITAKDVDSARASSQIARSYGAQ